MITKLSRLGRKRPDRLGDHVPITPEVLRKVRRLELRTRGFVESLFSGEHLSRFHGRGLEFSHVRSYQAGDDVRAIDWKVTARRGTPFVRQFVEERDLLVVLMVDVSASGWYGPGERSAAEVAAEIAAALAFAATQKHDRLALLLVSDRVEHFVRPGSGRRHVFRLLGDLLSHRPQGTGTNLKAGLDRVALSMSGRAVVFVISDFIHGGREAPFREALGRVARAHDVVAIRLASVATDELPDVGWVELTDPETGRRALINTGSRRLRDRYRRSVRQAQAAIAAHLTEVGTELIDVDTTTDPLAVLSQFFRRRRRVKR